MAKIRLTFQLYCIICGWVLLEKIKLAQGCVATVPGNDDSLPEFCNTCEGGPPTADGADWTQWTAGTGANPCLLADPTNPNAAPVPLTDPPSDYNMVDPTYHNSGSTATTCNGFFTCPAGTELAFGVLELNGQTACVALPYSNSLDRSFVCPTPANAPMTPALACGTLA